MKNNLKNKISTLFIIILMILSTLLACNVLAEELEEQLEKFGQMIIKSEHTRTYPNGSYIPLEHLNDYYDVFCCQHGTALPNMNQTSFEANGQVYNFPYLTMNDLGMTVGTLTTSGRCPYQHYYTHRTIGNYKIMSTNRATPEEAYILSEMIKVDGMGEYNYAQIAWWNTEAGSTGNPYSPNAFSYEAKAFEEYIKKASGITKSGPLVESDCKYKTVEFTDIDTGEKYTIENAFDFEYKPEWKSEDEFANPTVMYDQTTGTYTVGPFAIHYEGSTEKFGDREEVQFAGITGMELYTDASNDPLELGTDWEIICAETVRSGDTDYEFPKSDEAFYIKLNYIEDATQITNIKTKFKYMNAAGLYQKLQGTYFDATWTLMAEDNRDSKGRYMNTTYWLELTNLVEHESQRLALGLNGARWYEYTELDRSIGIKSKSLKIKKVLVDSEGELVNTNDFFDFSVSVNGALNSGSDKIRVKANNSAMSQVYYWLDGEAAPTYDVKELQNDEFEQVSIENASGSLDQPQEIVVTATNKIKENKGKIEVVKQIEKSQLDSSKFSLVGQQFKFKLTVSGTFKYEGVKYENTAITLYPEVTAVNEGETGTPWTSSEFSWIGDAPTYTIEEIDIPDEAELITILPSQGVIRENDPTRITAINKQKETGASIHIIKKLENADKISENKIKDLRFYFTLHVDGYDDIEIVTTPSRIEENGKYIWVWEYTSSEYVWLAGNAPTYTITEHNNPEGTEFASASSEDAENVSVSGSSITGTLVANEEKDFIVTNTIINKNLDRESNKGKLDLTKVVDIDKLTDRDYLFAVTITGNFRFESEAPELAEKTRTIQFTNNGYVEIPEGEYAENTYVTVHVDASKSATWSTDALGLGQIEWYSDEAPKYVVEESLVGNRGDGIQYATVSPSRGNLINNQTVKVTAKNYGTEKQYETGRLHIIKTLEDSEKYDASYINSLVFKFKITVDGTEPFEVALKAERVDNKFVWEYVSDEFFWEKGNEAPNYTIEEIDIPEGAEFVSAQGPDGSTTSGTSVSGKLKPSQNADILITTENSFINKLKEIGHEGKIEIKKIVNHESLNGKEFKFTLTLKGTFTYGGEEIVNGEKVIEDITVSGGNTWSSDTVKWTGNNAPSYSVTEAESEIAENRTVINGAGVMAEGTQPVYVTFVNDAKEVSGRIKIHKVIKDQPANENDKFTFRITVEGYEPFEVSIKADETYVSQSFKWYASEEAPKYKVEEVNLPDGTKQLDLSNAEGTLSKEEDITIEATNQYEEHRGRFIVRKAIVKDKITPENMPTFEFDIAVTGQFTLAGQETSTSEIWNEHATITGEGTYESPEFIWYGKDAPVVNVTELPLGEDAKGWSFEGISNNNAAISEDDVLEFVVTNKFEPSIVIDLTMELAGTVWNDVAQTDDKNMEGSKPNGLLDEGEIGIDGVEVYVYDNNGELATIYEDMSKNVLEQPIITANGGKWDAPRVKVLKSGSYDVKFVYDGQTYEPTQSLVSGSAESYKSASNSGRAAWFNDSMAEDINREEVNARLTEIKGNTPIDGSGNTVGTAVPGLGNDGSNILYEKSSGENENRISSKVVTLKDDGRVLDLYKAEATTSQAGLTYPFDERIHLESFDIQPSELGPEYRYIYSATYPYTLHINLGLINREIADADAIKDLVDAKVTVNEKLLTYKFNKLADVGKDVLSRESYINGTDGNNNIQYQLGFYKTDYYYRAEIYKTSKVYDYMDTFYKSIGQDLDTTNLEVYLRYKISVYNESPSYKMTINEIADYFDSSFGAPITTEVKKYVQTLDGKETDSSSLETVAKPSYVESTGATVEWNVTEKGIKGSDGITYNKMTTDALKGTQLASGEKAEIYVYFKVKPTSVEGVNNTIKLANKSNVVEITNYSTYYSDGRIAGKIDTDSAPDNINIRDYNEKPYYEDDTDSAPILSLTLDTDNGTRSLNGIAWEDRAVENDDNTAIGNGVYDNDEALIGGLTTQLIEKVRVKTGDSYTEYDFLWPTSENLSCFGGKTFEELTGFNSSTETARVAEGDDIPVGGYKFTGIPVGNYMVRFYYGNDKSELENTHGVSGDPVALKSDGTKFAENNKLVANYDGLADGAGSAVYNGQDFKATLFQVNNGDNPTEWHNLNEYQDSNIDSDFIDNEARRLNIIGTSTEITNVNGNVLSTANTYDTLEGNNPENYVQASNHSKLYEDYYMFADSGKFSFNVENLEGADKASVKDYEVETIETAGEGSVRIITNKRSDAYDVKNINIGLIERPETKLVLDKEISKIKLTTNDNRVIFDAEYDINYKVVKALNEDALADKVIVADLGRELINHKYLIAEVTLSEVNSIATDVMQAINKNENKLALGDVTGDGTQNFRYVNVDDTILQGTTIEIGYKMTALNISEKDTISSRLANISQENITDESGRVLSTKSKIKLLADELEEESKVLSGNPQEDKVLELGKYVGREYYKGTPADTDVAVTTRVRQVLDYVDSDGTFTANFNNTENHSWRNTTVNELLGDGYQSQRLIQESIASEHTINDKKDIEYMTSQRNNLVLSIDSIEQINSENPTELNNNGFEKVLQPLDTSRIDDESYDEYKSEIDLVITKVVAIGDDTNNLSYDNIAEIVKFENVAGRRDSSATPGNSNPNPDVEGEEERTTFAESLVERDQSATELITFSPPTGLEVKTGMTMQILAISAIALAVLAVGVVIIKKTVIK